jgi:hypothetical protein
MGKHLLPAGRTLLNHNKMAFPPPTAEQFRQAGERIGEIQFPLPASGKLSD